MSKATKVAKPAGVPVAEFKRNFHAYAAEVAAGHIVHVFRHGRPLGDFVPAGSGRGAAMLPVAERPGGLIALAGLFSDWDSLESDVQGILASRRRTGQRPAPRFD